MTRLINHIERYDPEESDEMFEYFEKIDHKRSSLKYRNDIRQRLDNMREMRDLKKIIRDELFDW
jgi:hypothetical protein